MSIDTVAINEALAAVLQERENKRQKQPTKLEKLLRLIKFW